MRFTFGDSLFAGILGSWSQDTLCCGALLAGLADVVGWVYFYLLRRVGLLLRLEGVGE